MTQKMDEPKSLLDKLKKRFLAKPANIKQFIEMLRYAEEKSIINSNTLSMIEGVLSVNEKQARDIMIPKPKMIILKADQKPMDILSVVIKSGHSRFPVAVDNEAKITGILHAKDILKIMVNDNQKNAPIHKMTRPPKFIPESKRLDILLKEFRQNKMHIAIVVDEYGQTSGLVTIEDVLEEIVGDIADEFDKQKIDYIIKKSNNTYQVNAGTPLNEFNEYFHTNFKAINFDTIGGLLLKHFSYFPSLGENIKINNYQFEITKIGKHDIQEIMVISPAEI
jgi:magnesium and cobalt transporter